jgi:hypothetical protein
VKTVLELERAFPRLTRKKDRGLSLLAQLARQEAAKKRDLMGEPIDRFDLEQLWRLTTGEPASEADPKEYEAQVDLLAALTAAGVLDEQPGRGYRFSPEGSSLEKELLAREAPPVHEDVPYPELDSEGRPVLHCPRCKGPLFYVSRGGEELWCPRDKRSWFDSSVECPECGAGALSGWIEEKDGEAWRVHGCRRCGATFLRRSARD